MCRGSLIPGMTTTGCVIRPKDLHSWPRFRQYRNGLTWGRNLRNEWSGVLVPNYLSAIEKMWSGMAVREPSPDLTEVSDGAWKEATRRLQIVRPLAENLGRTRREMCVAAAALGCRLTQAYVMLDRYLASPTATSLIPRRRGQSVADRTRVPSWNSSGERYEPSLPASSGGGWRNGAIVRAASDESWTRRTMRR